MRPGIFMSRVDRAKNFNAAACFIGPLLPMDTGTRLFT